MYREGSRNIAFKQSASQSTIYSDDKGTFGANLAVDGNTNGNFYGGGSCTHTRAGDPSPRFDLRLQSSYVINRFKLFNRDDDNKVRLKGFRLVAVDDRNESVFDYKDQLRDVQSVYYVNVVVQLPIKSITVNETTELGKFLTICEMEAFGECPPGRWSLPCTKQCSSLCPTNCHIDDGSCNSVCAGYSNQPNCTEACGQGKWGINCRYECSHICVNSSCDTKSGLCNQGCIGYRNPPYCTLGCLNSTWGINCSQTCSSNCNSTKCNANNGTCDQGCKAGFKPPDCIHACSSHYWGVNCSTECSVNCLNKECDHLNGSCSSGCVDGIQLPDCTKACKQGTYGRNCSLNCSSNCLNKSCDAITGLCIKCESGYEGDLCQKESSQTSTQVGVIVGPIVAGIIVVILVIAAVILWRKRKHLKLNNKSVKNGLHDLTSLEDIDNGINKTLELEEIQYCTIQDTDNTLIAVESLTSYLASRDKDFYGNQFQKIPAAKNVTQEIALSQENKHKNRYKNICPYDHSRVHLEINTERKEMDYINASYIRGFNEEVKFIATQGPQKATLIDFIRMLWEQRTEVVVMLTDLVEDSKVKCEKYWPDTDKMQVGHIKVKLGSMQVFADYTVRKLELAKKGESTQILTQFHFTSWPDKGVPSTQWSLVDVEQHVTAIVTNRPIVVHCSAGVGRTGTFIALYNIMRQAEETGCVDFFKTVSKLREDRIFMVQTVSQYEFLHKAAHVAIACMRTTLNIHDFSDRLKILLEERNASKVSKMDSEFKALCAVLEEREESSKEDMMVYANTERVSFVKNNSADSNDQNARGFVTLPGYKLKEQYVLGQLPTSQTEAADLWKLVTQNNILIVVSLVMESSNEKSASYYPTVSDQDLILPTFEIKLSQVSQKSVWEEQKLLIHSKKSTNFLSSSKSDADGLTHLKCCLNELDPKSWLEIAKKVRLCHSHTGGKIVFMCSDGVSLSGFMAVLSILLDRVDNESCLSVPLVVGAIRSLHPKILASLEQYRRLYTVVSRHIDTSTQYTNMEFSYYQNADKLIKGSVKKDES
ncbi:hypothetical protein Btru_026744 [Bulinus truncatus]|nr:hypothetical protein Btru_026744 [Bulinus truncatus]